eukprot:PDM81840.1 hypothetical protein PRIPAC_33994 [Pristionchus pacificus]
MVCSRVLSHLGLHELVHDEINSVLVDEQLPQEVVLFVVNGQHLATPFLSATEFLRSEHTLFEYFSTSAAALCLNSALGKTCETKPLSRHCFALIGSPKRSISRNEAHRIRADNVVKQAECRGGDADCRPIHEGDQDLRILIDQDN